MIRQLLLFELYFQRKQRFFLLGSLVFFLLGIMQGSQGFAQDLVHFNAPYQITFHTSLFTLGAVFIIMFFAISGLIRERQYQFESIVFSTGISKGHFFVRATPVFFD